MKKLFLLLAVCFIANCGPETQPKCFDDSDCSDLMELDTVTEEERSAAHTKAETYCKKHFKARGDAEDFAQCIAEMKVQYLEENEQ